VHIHTDTCLYQGRTKFQHKLFINETSLSLINETKPLSHKRNLSHQMMSRVAGATWQAYLYSTAGGSASQFRINHAI
jgi:hypothetical protein